MPCPIERRPSKRWKPSSCSARPMSCSWRTARGVSPSPQVFSRGKRFFSTTSTRRPRAASQNAAAAPDGPAPTTNTSYASVSRVRSQAHDHMLGDVAERSVKTACRHDVPRPASSVVARATRPSKKGAPGACADVHVWDLLALHVPNLLPKTIFGSHFPAYSRAPDLGDPSSSSSDSRSRSCGSGAEEVERTGDVGATIVGAMFVWVMLTWVTA